METYLSLAAREPVSYLVKLGVVLVASEPLSRRSILRTYNAAATKTPDHRSLTAKTPVARSLSPQ